MTRTTALAAILTLALCANTAVTIDGAHSIRHGVTPAAAPKRVGQGGHLRHRRNVTETGDAAAADPAAADPFACTDDDLGFTTQFMFLVTGALVFIMQGGFAMLEAGSVGSSCVTNILFKNMCDTLISGLMWFTVGWGFAYGGHSTDFIGGDSFFMMRDYISPCRYSDWFFQWTFCATTATIVSGAMAGRTQLAAYIVYSIVLTGWVYPVVVHWCWDATGWLVVGDDEGHGYSDFAGSGIVHACGGTAALVGAVMVGPRGTADFEVYENKWDIPGHNMPLVSLGTVILIFGFFGFNGGSVLSLETKDDAALISLAIVNTVMAATGGGLVAIVIQRVFHKHWSLMLACNGAIAGMVSVCASADTVWPWAALVIGMIGGIAFYSWSLLLHKLGVDDAIDAVGVHLGAGLWGVIAKPLFMTRGGDGILYGGGDEAWKMLGWNIAGVISIMVWTGGIMLITFGSLKAAGMLRVSDEHINRGIDIIEHGEAAYVFHGLKDTATVKKAVSKSSLNSDGHDITTAVFTNSHQL